MFALAGPTVGKEFERFAAHPTGQRLLAERPRRDLNALLADHERLATMPAGSFAAAYVDYMGGAGMGSSDYFLAAANLEEKAARFGWTEEQCWFVRRMANSHDLFHVLSGYDRTILGEIGVDAFTAGQIPLVPLKLLLAYLFFAQTIRAARLDPICLALLPARETHTVSGLRGLRRLSRSTSFAGTPRDRNCAAPGRPPQRVPDAGPQIAADGTRPQLPRGSRNDELNRLRDPQPVPHRQDLLRRAG